MQVNPKHSTENKSIDHPNASKKSKNIQSKKPVKQVKFASETKSCPTPSPYSSPLLKRGEIWWQTSEMNEFRKLARIITKPSLSGKSEVWLNKEKVNSPESEDEMDSDQEHGSKWWCKFGHSRRGLEHLCNLEEGRSRQKNAKVATKAVIEEQKRQRLTGNICEKLLASVSRQNTSWARDLAHATGLADQEAVMKGFSSLIKSRNDYVLQSLRRSKYERYINVSGFQIQAADVIGINPRSYVKNTSYSNVVCRKRPSLTDGTHKSCDSSLNIESRNLVKKATLLSV